MEDINGEFGTTDVALILGANDVGQPACAREGQPIYGMPIIEANKARTVLVNKAQHGRRLRRPRQPLLMQGGAVRSSPQGSERRAWRCSAYSRT